MNNAKRYFQNQLDNPRFRQSYLEEKVKLDIEYFLEDLKLDIKECKSGEEIIEKINRIEKYIMSV